MTTKMVSGWGWSDSFVRTHAVQERRNVLPTSSRSVHSYLLLFELLLGDEIDGKDEAMLPSDFTTAGALLDDHVYKKFVLPMREGVHVVSLVSLSGNDRKPYCCHDSSG